MGSQGLQHHFLRQWFWIPRVFSPFCWYWSELTTSHNLKNGAVLSYHATSFECSFLKRNCGSNRRIHFESTWGTPLCFDSANISVFYLKTSTVSSSIHRTVSLIAHPPLLFQASPRKRAVFSNLDICANGRLVAPICLVFYFLRSHRRDRPKCARSYDFPSQRLGSLSAECSRSSQTVSKLGLKSSS